MKMTLDLPPALVKQVKLRALHEGKKLKDAFADLLQRGLAASRAESAMLQPQSRRSHGSLPLVKCKHAALPEETMTPERVARILQAF